MAEQHKGSSSADSKEKSSLLDDKIGKEFLSSWESMSMADDDAMDFSFDTVSKGKKKTFDFEKLDMNFNLDGEFDKISSFKVDMSDLDFTCPPKNSSQSKDKKGESSGAKAGKQDGFTFSFDFNELDSFNLDSSLIKEDTNSNSNPRKKGVNTEGSDNDGPKMPKTNDDESVYASNDSMAMKPSASEKLETLKVDTLVGNLGNLASRQDGSVSKFSSSGSLDMPIENQTSDISKTIRTKEMDQERDFPEKTKSTESKPGQVINMAPSQSVGQSDSEQDTIPEKHTKVFSSGTKVINVSGDKQKVINKATYVNSNGVDLKSEHSSLLYITKPDSSVGEAINPGSGTQEGVSNDPHPKNSDAIKKISCDNNVRENKKSTLECHLAPESSKPIVGKMMLIKDKELRVVHSNMVSRPEEKSSLKHPSSTAGTKGISFGCKKNGDMRLRSITQASYVSNDTRIESRLVSDSLPGSGKLMRDGPALLGCKDDIKSCSGCKDDIKSCSNTSFQVSPSCLTEKTARNTTQMSANSQAEVLGKESSQKSRIISIERNKLSSFKAGKITPALSNLKTLRNIGANMVLSISLHQKEANSSVRSEQSMEIQGTTTSKNDHLTNSGDNQKPSTQFLKRKTIEVSEADLTSLRSLKRLSHSPSKSRNSKEFLEEVVEQVESKPNNILCNHPTSGLESPPEIKLTEVEIPDSVLMKDNSNVEKAEAYMKELEDICNMLKKKHEEAKELLVRAIVNDNNLLMLNHPIYEEKIRKVQKFASQLMSKGTQP